MFVCFLKTKKGISKRTAQIYEYAKNCSTALQTCIGGQLAEYLCDFVRNYGCNAMSAKLIDSISDFYTTLSKFQYLHDLSTTVMMFFHCKSVKSSTIRILRRPVTDRTSSQQGRLCLQLWLRQCVAAVFADKVYPPQFQIAIASRIGCSYTSSALLGVQP